jgi:hypothetical protein
MAIRNSGLPRWVKLTLWFGVLAVILAVGAMLFGHNPLQHMMDHSE